MRKKLHYFLMILMSWMLETAFAQGDNGFHVRFSTVDATCYNNGKVVYALTDPSGTVLDSLPQRLSQVRVYYKLSESDSAHYAGWYYTGGSDTLTVDYGNYIVGVEALWADSTGGYVRVDTQTVLTLSTSYQKPTAAVVALEARYRSRDAGTFPAVTCADVGRVQLRILYGQFPYKVTVTDTATGDTLRTDIFHDRQYSGTEESRFDFRDYYSIDTMPGGVWYFHVEDGCGYGLPALVETVATEKLPTPYRLSVFASTGNPLDSNVVKFSISFVSSLEGLQGLIHQHASYRLVYDGLAVGEWHPMPYDTTVSNIYILYDTVESVGRYCDLWNRDIAFEYQLSDCGSAHTTRIFQYWRPNGDYFAKDSMDVSDSVRLVDGNCVREDVWHRQSYGIRYFKQDANPQYSPDHSTPDHEHEYYRYHYTHPLTWVYTDTRTGDTVKRHTVSQITTKSTLSFREVTALYGDPGDSVLALPISRTLIDGKGCELYATFDTLRYMRSVERDSVCWKAAYKDEGGQCCSSPRWVCVYRSSSFGGPADGTTISLTRSPQNNLYNFVAVYHAVDKSWTIEKENIGNTAAITGHSDGKSLYISDYCLPSGPYEFEIVTSCGTSQVAAHAAFGDYMEMRVSEEVECVTRRDCGNLYIDYPKGAFQWVRTNTSPTTGLPVDTVFQGVSVKARIVAAPSASLVGHESYYQPSFIFSMPGTYVLQICPNLSVNECSEAVCRYDTFQLDAATVEFVEAVAVLCDTSSTEGNAWIRADNGMPPYTYTLYDQSDKQGNILATNDSGVFENIPMRSEQTLSCLVRDSCDAYFHVNFQPRVMAGLQKLWFDDWQTGNTACEGSIVQIHALAVGNIWQYEWSGPDGFSSTSAAPYVFVPRGGGDGWYKVSIRQTDCSGEISDSIYLSTLPAPTLTIAADTTVCPGETVALRFTPRSPTTADSIRFSVAFANASRVEIRDYTALPDATVVDTFTTLSSAKIYPVNIDDGRCGYPVADPSDTVYIQVRTDITDVCRLITTFDTVCYGGTARLTAKSTDMLPYVIRWYGDYNQTHLLKTDTIFEGDGWSRYDTAGITRRTLLFISLQKDGECPSVNGLIDSAMTMRDGDTYLSCGRHIRVCGSDEYEDGISYGETLLHRFHTSDGTRASIHFDKLNLDGPSHLLVFSGGEMDADSLLSDIKTGDTTLQTVVSQSNTLTLCFVGPMARKSDWSGVVESAPGVAVADVRNSGSRLYRDEVCQSRTSGYDDPYGMIPDVVSATEVAMAMRNAGNYYFTRTFPAVEEDGCDSVVEFQLIVNPPSVTETVAVAPRNVGYLWHDSLYTTGGSHSRSSTTTDGCDHIDILYLTILDANCPDEEICQGDSVRLTVDAVLAAGSGPATSLPRYARPGDVLCTDGSLLAVDSFLVTGKSPKGVVFHVDETGMHGLAVALTEVDRAFMHSTPQLFLSSTYFSWSSAANDFNGEDNTLNLRTIDDAYASAEFTSDAIAASYCHFYNHNTLTADGESHGWYLPSFGELNLMLGNLWDVKQTLNRLKTVDNSYKSFESSSYWSSTLRDKDNAWFRSASSWYQGNLSMINGVRPITKF